MPGTAETRRRRASTAVAAVASAVVAACGSAPADRVPAAAGAATAGREATAGAPTTTTTAPTTTTAAPTTTTTIAVGPDQATLDAVTVAVEEVARGDQPTSVAMRPGDAARYWTEVRGAVWGQAPGAEPRLVLDLRGEVSLEGEQGLFALDFSPGGDLLYVSFTDLDGRSRVVELAMSEGVADLATWRDVLVVDQPTPLHNGGDLQVTADGLLWVAVGDGGVRFDPAGNAQSPGTLLGKLLRVDPRPSGDAAYGLPAGNAFAPADGRPEIWALGLRNPWRFHVDEATGDVWVGDVGQYVREEVTRIPAGAAGANLGWAQLEGTLPVRGRPAPATHLPPTLEYDHDDGRCAVTGGYVYRGAAIPALQGAYLFADLCDGRLRALSHRDGQVVARRPLGVEVPQAVAIVPDLDGEPLVVSMAGGIHRVVPTR